MRPGHVAACVPLLMAACMLPDATRDQELVAPKRLDQVADGTPVVLWVPTPSSKTAAEHPSQEIFADVMQEALHGLFGPVLRARSLGDLHEFLEHKGGLPSFLRANLLVVADFNEEADLVRADCRLFDLSDRTSASTSWFGQRLVYADTVAVPRLTSPRANFAAAALELSQGLRLDRRLAAYLNAIAKPDGRETKNALGINPDERALDSLLFPLEPATPESPLTASPARQ